MQFPRLRAHFEPVVVDDKVFLVAEDRHFLVQGRAAIAVLPYLDGRNSIADIALALTGTLSPGEVMLGVRKYQAAGHLTDGRPDLPAEAMAHWDAAELDAVEVAANLAAADVAILTLPGPDPARAGRAAAAVTAALAANGVHTRQSTLDDELAGGGAVGGVTIVLAGDYLDPRLGELNAAYLRSGRSWLLARGGGEISWVGPLLTPGETGCWACLQQRLAGNRQVENYLARKGRDGVDLTRSMLPSNLHLLAGLLAAEVAHLVAAGTAPNLAGSMTTVDSRTLVSTRHTLIKQPQCPVCGDPDVVAQRPTKIELQPIPVAYDDDGGLRMVQPEVTVARLDKHISRYLGAVTQVVPTLDSDARGLTYSFTAGHNFAMYRDNMHTLRKNLRGQSGGKGRTEAQAKASAVCEAIERYSGVWRGTEPVHRVPFDALGPDLAVHPDLLTTFSPSQYLNRREWNKDPLHRLHVVPEPFRADHPIDWTRAWSLTEDTERYVPTATVWYGHPDLDDHFYAAGDSNGSASGNSLEEAIIQGFCEVVERDAVALWWYNRARRPEVDLDSMGDPYVDRLREFYASRDRSLYLLDVTTDLGVPAFIGVSHRTRHPSHDIILGFGAHPSARLAAMRALTEVNQFWPAVELVGADGNTIFRYDDEATLAFWEHTTLEKDPWLAPDPSLPRTRIDDFPDLVTGDLASNVRTCVDLAAKSGLEMIVVDLTRPDIELSVAKVVVPTLRHFWRRLGPGRLYDVPVSLGWLDTPTAEADMNPQSVFF